MTERAAPAGVRSDAVDARIRSVAIVGGGTAGWMTAAALARLVMPAGVAVTLVESEAIGTVGVGEATIPPIVTFNRMLGIDEPAFLRATGATFKLGIEFADWARIGDRYAHPFGRYGTDMAGVSFRAWWQRLDLMGEGGSADDYALASVAARRGRFMRPVDAGNSPLSQITYAYHLDAGRYARFLRAQAEGAGVVRREGEVVAVHRAADGLIAAVELAGGERIAADLFVDCSGFRALLIGAAMGAKWHDWSGWLPCDRAVSVATAPDAAPRPFTRATARAAGWQWRIPLQHRTGNGHVFSSRHLGEDEATATLLSSLDAEPLGAPATIRFRTGHREAAWIGNCVAIGLAAGFVEPLESTGLWLIQTGIARLVTLFPDRAFAPAGIARYNRLLAREFAQIRDFLLLHYRATERDDTAFWREARTGPLPESLAEKIRIYREHGRTFRDDDELFNETSWFAVMNGQRLRPAAPDPLTAAFGEDELRHRLARIRDTVARSADHMPDHRRFLADYGGLAQELT